MKSLCNLLCLIGGGTLSALLLLPSNALAESHPTGGVDFRDELERGDIVPTLQFIPPFSNASELELTKTTEVIQTDIQRHANVLLMKHEGNGTIEQQDQPNAINLGQALVHSEIVPSGDNSSPSEGNPKFTIDSSASRVHAQTHPVEEAADQFVKQLVKQPSTIINDGAFLEEGDRHQLLMEADRLWRQGDYAAAELLYRQAKNPGLAAAVGDRPDPIYDPALLSPAGRVYWREAEAGQQTNLVTRMVVPLELLTEQYPEFIPGHLRYANVLTEQDQHEEALQALERATTLYPKQPDLVQARVDALVANEHWLEASIAARQFALLYPNDPLAPDFAQLADDYLDEFKDEMRDRLRGHAIANVITGALGYALTGGLFGPISALQTSVTLLRGESNVGESIAENAAENLPLVQDEVVVAYVNELGQRLAAVSGRSEFEYEFYVIRDPELNAFALPGGKIFVNAGAIALANSEAEMAALLAHEISHAVLSHGFQLMTQANLTANVFQFFPYGGLASDLTVLGYSRDMERQADELATRMLATSGYAADGLQNLMMTLSEQPDYEGAIEWLSTHPNATERIQDISEQIDRNGYNRYAYEGIERHLAIQQRVQRILDGPNLNKPSNPELDKERG